MWFFFNGTLRKFYFFSKLSFSSFVFCFHYVAMAYTKPGRTLWSISEAFLGLNDIQHKILSKLKNELDITLKVEFWLKNKGDFFFNGTLRKFYFFSKLSFSSFVFCFHYVAMKYTKPGRTLWSNSRSIPGTQRHPTSNFVKIQKWVEYHTESTILVKK